MGFPATASGAESVVYQTSSKQGGTLGQRMELSDGRVFRYAKNGSVSLVAGTVVRPAEQEPFHANLAVAAASAAKAATIQLTNGIVPIDIGHYKGGFLYVNDGAGQGYVYSVKENSGAAISGTCVVTVKGGVLVAVTTSSEATLVPHAYDSVVPSFKEPSDAVLGVIPCAVPANEHFWAQTWGPAAALQEGTLFPGKPIGVSRDTRGAVATSQQLMKAVVPGIQPDTTHATAVSHSVDGPELKLAEVSGHAILPEVVIGYCLDARADTEHALVFLTLLS